jgi:short-subunit dehydrogenase involved in D-alanine esterification of teichoic acids
LQEERDSLIASVVADYPGFNVLINNAGIQKKVSEFDPPAPRPPLHFLTISTRSLPKLLPLNSRCVKIQIVDTFDIEEMTVNFEAPVHLCHLVIPHIQGKANATM